MKSIKRAVDWVKNYGYAYKVTAIVAVAVLAFVISLVVHYASIVDPDYVVVIAVEDSLMVNQQHEAIKTQLEQYGDDINGDGKVVIEQLYISLADINTNPNAYAAQQMMLATELSGDRWGIIAFDKSAFKRMADLELINTADYTDAAGKINAWQWNGSAFFNQVFGISETDAELYFAARVAPEGASDKVVRAAENGAELLKRVINAK